MNAEHQHHSTKAPIVTSLQVIPVAGHDSMLLNLSGAHGPFFTRNIIILKDSSGNIGVGEVPGGERIRETLEDARSLVVGQPIGNLGGFVAPTTFGFLEQTTGSIQGGLYGLAGTSIIAAIIVFFAKTKPTPTAVTPAALQPA